MTRPQATAVVLGAWPTACRPVAGLDNRLGPAFFQGGNPEFPVSMGWSIALDNTGIRNHLKR